MSAWPGRGAAAPRLAEGLALLLPIAGRNDRGGGSTFAKVIGLTKNEPTAEVVLDAVANESTCCTGAWAYSKCWRPSCR